MINNLGIVVKKARTARGFSQAFVADEVGTSIGFIGKLERGQTGVRAARIKPLSKALRVPLKVLVAATVADFEAAVWKSVRG